MASGVGMWESLRKSLLLFNCSQLRRLFDVTGRAFNVIKTRASLRIMDMQYPWAQLHSHHHLSLTTHT